MLNPSRTRSRRSGLMLLVPLALVVVVPAVAQGQTTECETIDFDEFEHGDAIESLSLLGGTLSLTLSAQRNSPAGAVSPTAYDTELYDAGNPPPNATHNDTQLAFDCNEASNGGVGNCDGRTLVIPDTNFIVNGDDTEGGFVTISGFGDGTFEIPSYAAVDSDNTDRDIILRVGPGLVQVGTSTGQGNGTVETVTTTPHVFSQSVEFEFEGSGGIDEIEICRIEEPFCGDGVLDAGEECDDGNNEDGDGCDADCMVEEAGGQGCTPGYWKQPHHFDSWEGFAPSDDFETVFGVMADALAGKTLLEVLRTGGGGEKALGRHAVAALLGASSSEVDYFDTVAGVIARVQEAYATGEFEDVKDLLDTENNRGCPLD